MKFNWFFLLFSMFTFHIVEDEAGGEPADVAEDDQATADDSNDEQAGGDEAASAEPETAEIAVLQELGLNEDGTKKAEDEGEGAADADKAEADAKTEEDAAKKPEDGKAEGLTDADLAPLESKNKDTNERFRKVTEGYKQEKERADAAESRAKQYQQSFDSLRQLGFADADAANDLVEFSQYRHVLATGDEKVFAEIIAQQVRQFESIHGKKISIKASALDEFPDLKEKVDVLELDEQTALELASSRINQRMQRENKQRAEQKQQTAQSQTQVLEKAVGDVEVLQATWQKNDPDYPAILPHLQPQMTEIGRNYPPHMWPQLIELQYKTLKKSLVEAKGNRGNNLPLRGNGYQSGKPAPSSAEEAVLQELGLDGQ